ncbi:MAG: DUF6477 family protein [Rhodobacterales bacterium]|nr:DUF6477 family protein [Rhodobacterales bacterium]MDX5390477.1 DUF6477 family protein [Rhodobacterales bacterium]MDX5490172.1 DUF6477 family protein [Rhodobacterales bacterium]
MNDILHRLDALRRPRLLIRTARIGAEDYRRDVHLPRLLGHGGLPRNASALERLMEIEAVLDQSRRDGATGYSTIRHVEVMIAMMGEARLLRALHPPLTQRPAIAIVGDAILEPLA